VKRLIKTLDSNNKLKHYLLILTVFLLFIGLNCVNSLDQGSSDDPVNTGIIFVNPIPFAIFGNSIDQSLIEVLTQVFPNGSVIEFEITGSDLPPNLRGCVFGGDVIIVNDEAVANYLAGILIASGAELSSSEPPVATLNIAANIITPDGDEESDFGPLFLFAVGIIPPEDQGITTNPADDPLSVFLTLVFQTIGIPPGTIVTFALSDPTLGSLFPLMTPVLGSEDSGTATTQYTTFNNTGGTQIITATIILPNPVDFDPDCPNVPVAQRTIQEDVIIVQSAPQPTPIPSPTPIPTPTPVPTPTPAATIDLVCPDEVVSGDQDTCTCSTDLGPGVELCFFVISPAMPSLAIAPPACANTDSGGDALKIIVAGAVISAQVNLVQCCISGDDTTCNPPGDLEDVQAVTVVPSEPTLPDLVCPDQLVSGAQDTCTCSTNLGPGEELCFQVISGTTLDVLPADPNCVDTDSGGDAITVIEGDLMGGMSAMVNLVQCCISDNDQSCDSGDPDDVESVTVVPVPTPTPTPVPPPTPTPTPTPAPIIIMSTDPSPPPGGTPFINVFTSSSPGTGLCVVILADGTTGGSTLTGPFPFPPVTACDIADAFGDSIGLIQLTISGAATSGQSISLQGCIDSNFDGSCFGEILSPVIFVTVP
jgi:hypothetical protein